MDHMNTVLFQVGRRTSGRMDDASRAMTDRFIAIVVVEGHMNDGSSSEESDGASLKQGCDLRVKRAEDGPRRQADGSIG